jgi:hypothetical protein
MFRQNDLRYKVLNDEETICCYCGMPRETYDHWPPIAYAHNYECKERYLVSSCHECNTLLQAKEHLSFHVRREEVRDMLYRKYRNYLAMPDWHGPELYELGDRLRQETILSLTRRDQVRERLDFDYIAFCALNRPFHLLPKSGIWSD